MSLQKDLKFLLLFCAFCFSLFSSFPCGASEQETATDQPVMVQVSRQELTQVLTEVQNSRQKVQTSQQELRAAKSQLKELQTELKTAQSESEQLKSDLTLLSTSSQKQTQDLEQLNAELLKSSTEIKTQLSRQQKTIKRQRIFIYILLGAGVTYVLRN